MLDHVFLAGQRAAGDHELVKAAADAGQAEPPGGDHLASKALNDIASELLLSAQSEGAAIGWIMNDCLQHFFKSPLLGLIR